MEKLFEKLWEASKRDAIEGIKFGLVAVDVSGAARHFCGYPTPPTQNDWDNLDHELRTDESFGLVGESFTLERAPQEVIDCYLQEFAGSWRIDG